jgi:hypothetical protein
MAKVEIEESDLLSMRHVAGVVEQVMAVPEARSQFLRLAKQANPKLSIPEVDAAAPVYAAMNGINTKMDQFIEATKQAEIARQAKLDEFLAAQETARATAEENSRLQAFQRTWEQQKEDLRKQGWRQSGLDQVTAFAETHGIADLTIAADAFERRNPQPGPAESRPGWNLFQQPEQEDTFVKDQMGAQGNDDARLDREIAATLAEIREGY